jgi:hypothetical protein
MKILKLVLIGLAVFSFFSLYSLSSSSASEVEARVRAALALGGASTTPKSCNCGVGCSCAAGECGDPACPTHNYETAYHMALQEHKPLCVWINCQQTACEQELTEYRHVHVAEYDGQTSPCCIVAVPDGNGGFDVVSRQDHCSAASIRQRPSFQQVVPQFQPMPMMGFFGGGGCSS